MTMVEGKPTRVEGMLFRADGEHKVISEVGVRPATVEIMPDMRGSMHLWITPQGRPTINVVIGREEWVTLALTAIE